MKRAAVMLSFIAVFAYGMTAVAQAPEPKAEPPKEEVKPAEPVKDAPAVPAKVETKKEDPAKVPETIEDAKKQVGWLTQAVTEKHWSLAIGLILSLLVFFLDKFVGIKEKVSKEILPWVVVALGVAGVVGGGLAANLPVADVLVQGLLTGQSAIALWELVLKHFLRTKEPATVA